MERLIVGILLSFSCAAHAETVVGCTPTQAAAVLSVKELPNDVQKVLTRDGPVADAGGKFNSSDVILDATVPRQRLVAVLIGDNCLRTSVERGGRGYSVRTSTFQRLDGQWRLVSEESR